MPAYLGLGQPGYHFKIIIAILIMFCFNSQSCFYLLSVYLRSVIFCMKCVYICWLINRDSGRKKNQEASVSISISWHQNQKAKRRNIRYIYQLIDLIKANWALCLCCSCCHCVNTRVNHLHRKLNIIPSRSSSSPCVVMTRVTMQNI